MVLKSRQQNSKLVGAPTQAPVHANELQIKKSQRTNRTQLKSDQVGTKRKNPNEFVHKKTSLYLMNKSPKYQEDPFPKKEELRMAKKPANVPMRITNYDTRFHDISAIIEQSKEGSEFTNTGMNNSSIHPQPQGQGGAHRRPLERQPSSQGPKPSLHQHQQPQRHKKSIEQYLSNPA